MGNAVLVLIFVLFVVVMAAVAKFELPSWSNVPYDDTVDGLDWCDDQIISEDTARCSHNQNP